MSCVYIASVAIEKTNFSYDKAYDYLVDGSALVTAGCRVLVPFGRSNQYRQGFVTDVRMVEEKPKGLKKISKVLDSEPVLSEEMLKLMHWMKEQTFCTMFEAARSMLPAGMCHRVVTTYTYVVDVDKTEMSGDEFQIYSYFKESQKYLDGEKVI